MSDLIKTPQIADSKDCPASSYQPIHQRMTTRIAQIGENLTIRRALPHRDRKMIGAWCFLDHFGPLDLKKNKGLNIAPHPHIGLQTFTWTLSGEILHRDSLGYEQVIKPGQVNLMTAGDGIAHSEESLPDSLLHGVQLWIALPNSERHMPANFHHYSTVPTFEQNGLKIHLLAGEFLNTQAPPQVYTPLLGLEVQAMENTLTALPLNPKFEYGILPLIGNLEVEGEIITMDSLLYLGCGRSKLVIRALEGARFLIIGGEPFREEILLWWNFVARTQEEIVKARTDWENHVHFGEVKNYQGERLTAPELVVKK